MEQDVQKAQCMATEISVAVSCLSLNFSLLVKLSWYVLLRTPQTEQGMMILPTLFLASVAFFLPILWFANFRDFFHFTGLLFPPPLNQQIFFCPTWICYLLLLPSATSAFPYPWYPLKLCDLLYKSSHPPSLICHFWTLFEIILLTSSMKWVLLAERHSSFTECAQAAWDYVIKKKLQFLIGNAFRC